MYTGQNFSYKVSPSLGIQTNWVSEITHVDKGSFFVDEQRFGPYRMWHHEHHFEVQGNGVLMTDRVSYKLPFGFLGRIAHSLFVRKQLEQIFSFRKECLKRMFGKASSIFVLNSDSTVFSLWLFPRIARFQHSFPTVLDQGITPMPLHCN